VRFLTLNIDSRSKGPMINIRLVMLVLVSHKILERQGRRLVLQVVAK
jgi:hypothetical protein